MNTLYIHIGSSKTGTSAIQAVLRDNANRLLESGIYYPLEVPQETKRAGKAGIRSHLKKAAKKTYHVLSRILPKKQYAEGGGNANKLAEAAYDKVPVLYHELLSGIPGQDRNVLLSSEAYWVIDDKKAYFSQLKNLPYTIKVIVYLRRQDEYLSSLVNQFIKQGTGTTFQYPKCLNGYHKKDIRLDYLNELEQIASVIGRENIIVRRYRSGTDVVADFISVLNIRLEPDEKRFEKIVNPHLNLKCMKIMCFFNKLKLGYVCNRILRRILTNVSVKSGYEEKLNLWDAAVNKEIMDKYRDGNNQLAKLYLNEENLF